jgi:hypothetical protein
MTVYGIMGNGKSRWELSFGGYNQAFPITIFGKVP